MPTFTENRVLWIALLVILALIIFSGGYLAYLQKSGIPQPVAQDTSPDTGAVVLSGTYVCLPHTDGSKTKECTPGIKTDAGEYYALDMAKIIAGGTSAKLANNTKIIAGGTIVPIEEISTDQWKAYPVKGIMAVEEVAKQ
ncbi:hypothetical protein A2765_01475 [Candidatus Kaiserbacteria bacterium RIFCSPHIGHO2_01_FULL_56_24]|uniref:Uncharacterized protein n=1 Tax=Candidatus Kaiserbacteria bacterium RIFCSPHIGHO2_01_FULL_56_24 TaxID=1798487 RepID=A0A1F6DHA8_9BACT|nr:MAG: hypothetical protein A2765_01475 [Candidatus Kaiserbacteria bacterium RIFCSPHIGHO2_01_FULL_56_24]